MQNRYAGDVGDFGKFSILRTLFTNSEYRLGVVWYLYPDESHNDDGRHIEYLGNIAYKLCDSAIVERLSKIVNGERSVEALEKSKLLPDSTVYYSKLLSFYHDHPGQKAIDKQARKEARAKWLVEAVHAVSDCNVVFLDPDNGLEVNSIPQMTRKTSGKYAYYLEIDELLKGKDICVIYHHLNRNCTHDVQIKMRLKELSNHTNEGDVIFALRFKPYSPRAYFILTRKNKVRSVRKKLQEYISSPCGFGWDSYYER